MNIVRATSKLTITRTMNAVISFVGLAFFARQLGPEQMGVYFLFHTLMAVLTIPADFGIRGAVQKRISEGEDPEDFLTTGTLFKLLPLSIISIGILLFSRPINQYIGADLASLLIVALALEEYSTLAMSVLKGELKVGQTAVVQLLQQITWVIVGVTMVFYGFEARALVFAVIAGYSVELIVGTYRWSTSFGSFSLEKAASLWNFSKYNWITNIGGFVHNWLDLLLIGFFLGQSAAGVYEIAWRVATSLILFTRALAESIFPQVSSWHAIGDTNKIEKFISNAILFSLLLVIPGVIGITLLSEEILGFVFGQEYAVASLALIILAGGMCFETVHIIFGRTVGGMDHPEIGAQISPIRVALNILLNAALIPVFGIQGAAIGTVVSFSVGTIILGYRLSNLVTIRIPGYAILYLIGASAGMGIIVYLTSDFWTIDSMIDLFAVVTVGVTVYFISIYFIVPLRVMLVESVQEFL